MNVLVKTLDHLLAAITAAMTAALFGAVSFLIIAVVVMGLASAPVWFQWVVLLGMAIPATTAGAFITIAAYQSSLDS